MPTVATPKPWSSKSRDVQNCSLSVTTAPVERFNHTWVIERFPGILLEKTKIKSTFFPPESEDQWFLELKLHPIFERGRRKEYFGLKLFLRSCPPQGEISERRAFFSFSLLDSQGSRQSLKDCCKSNGRVFEAKGKGYGWSLFASCDALLDASNNLIGERSSIQICCDLTVYGEMVTSSAVRVWPLAEPTLVTNSWKSDMRLLLEKETEWDVNLIAKDGSSTKVHRVVLMARSPVFGAMFSHDMMEKKKSRVNLSDMTRQVVQLFATFLYTDELEEPMLSQHSEDLLMAADKYDVKRLKATCESHLMRIMTTESVGHFLALADVCNAQRLKERAIDLMSLNFNLVLKTESWQKQVFESPFLYKEAFLALVKRQRFA